MAPEGCAGLLPIPRGSREHDSVAHLKTSRVQAMAESSERQDSPEIDRGGSSRPYPVTGKAETLDAVWQVSRDASGVRTASIQPKEFMGTRESRQVQA